MWGGKSAGKTRRQIVRSAAQAESRANPTQKIQKKGRKNANQNDQYAETRRNLHTHTHTQIVFPL